MHSYEFLADSLTDGAPLTGSFILSNSIYMYICFSIDFRRCERLQRPGNSLPPGVAYLRTAYGQTADVCDIFPSALCGCH